MFDIVIREMAKLKEIEAIALGGSKATNSDDSKSDYDVYVYLIEELPEIKRREILSKYCNYMEYSNNFWELEDDGILNNGIEIEFIYRRFEDIEKMITNTLEGNVGHGFNTCFIDNIVHSKILIDKSKRLTVLKTDLSDVDYKFIAQRIIDSNFPLLNGSLPSMFNQINKAVIRRDLHSINHRVTAYFEIYYDILFSVNLVSHPGEKRLLEKSLLLDKLPIDHKENIVKLFDCMYLKPSSIPMIIESLSNNLESLIIDLGFNINKCE